MACKCPQLLTSSFSASARLLVYEQQICHEGLDGKVALAVTDNPESQIEHTTLMGQDSSRIIGLRRSRSARGSSISSKAMTTSSAMTLPGPTSEEQESSCQRSMTGPSKRSVRSCVNSKFENITENINLDAFSPLDKVLLHEMTHGRTAFEELRVPGGEKETIDDVRLPIITSAIDPRLRD
jgi:hypothetical protein